MIRISQFGPITRFDLARTLLGRGRYWTTAYLLDNILIDSGGAYTAPELLKALTDVRLDGLINTHSHEDHIGANAALQNRQPGLLIRAHPLGLVVLTNPRETQPLQPYRRLFWGLPKPSIAQSLTDGEEIKTEKYTLKIMYTSGHSRDHLCLYETQHGWLFSGDLFVGGKDRALRKDCNIWRVIADLKKAVTLPLTALFPGSAKVRLNPTEELLTKIDYYQELAAQIRDLHQRGWKADVIARQVFGGRMPVEFITLGHFSRLNLVQSFLRDQSA